MGLEYQAASPKSLERTLTANGFIRASALSGDCRRNTRLKMMLTFTQTAKIADF